MKNTDFPPLCELSYFLVLKKATSLQASQSVPCYPFTPRGGLRHNHAPTLNHNAFQFFKKNHGPPSKSTWKLLSLSKKSNYLGQPQKKIMGPHFKHLPCFSFDSFPFLTPRPIPFFSRPYQPNDLFFNPCCGVLAIWFFHGVSKSKLLRPIPFSKISPTVSFASTCDYKWACISHYKKFGV